MSLTEKIIEYAYRSIDELISDPATSLSSRTMMVFAGALFSSYVYLRYTRQRYSVVPRWPPGPRSWPFVGSSLSLRSSDEKRTFDVINDITKQYGPMVHMYLGADKDLVVLTGIDMIREAYVENADVFSNRPLHMKRMKSMSHYHRGIVMNHGPVYKAVRRFTMKTMKDFGVGKLSLESSIQEESKLLISLFLKEEGKAFDPKFTINNSVSNIICSLIFGQRYDHDNKEFRKMLEALDTLFANSGSQNIAIAFLPTFILKMFSTRFKKILNSQDQIDAHILKIVNQHRLDFDINNLRDFTDYYLKSEVEQDGIDMEDMFKLIFDLFLTGTETTSTTLRWLILFLIRNPQVHQKCTQEIHSVIGTSRMPAWKDKENLPYLVATLMETQRHANLVPLGVVHCTSRPVEIRGFLLPEETLVMANMTECLYNESDYPGNGKFLPERWLNQDGSITKEPPKTFIPFGIGPRSCAGENLAKMELFLFSACLLQQLQFSGEFADKPPSDRAVMKATLVPQEFNIRVSTAL